MLQCSLLNDEILENISVVIKFAFLMTAVYLYINLLG